MQISVSNPELQTLFFGILFIFAVILSIRGVRSQSILGISRTEELKGFAILAIIFSHIGYFLVDQHGFLFPFSILAGVGVNLFLFLSGFGLTISALKSPLNIFDFYKKRLKKLFIPMWIVVSILVILEFLILKKSYSLTIIWHSLLGYFPVADPFESLDSPLWYFSLILFYYLSFPLFFWKRFSYLYPVIIFLLTSFLLQQPIPIKYDVVNLYKLHSIAFPLGVFLALIASDAKLVNFRLKIRQVFFHKFFKYFLILIALAIFAYTSINSGVGGDKNMEQEISLVTMFACLYIFVAKDWEFKIFNLFGKFSYEVYLMHWPILIEFGLLYTFLPASLATIAYLGVFLVLSFGLQKLTNINLIPKATFLSRTK